MGVGKSQVRLPQLPCAICPNRASREKILRPHGNRLGRLLFLGENPGHNEHRRGIPFVGEAGEEFNERFLPMLRIGNRFARREDVMVHNACSCFLPDGVSPTTDQARSCAEIHVRELVESMPNLEVVVLMGGTALRLVDEKASADLEHGIPRRINFYGRSVIAFPIIHPAAGLHQPAYTKQLLEDFETLRDGLAGRWNWIEDEYEGMEDYALLAPDEMRELNSLPKDALIGLDTENFSDDSPAMLQISAFEGWGRAIRADDGPKLSWLSDWAQGREFAIHHAKHDLRYTKWMSVFIDIDAVDDTMIRAYNLGEPRGLKSMAYRYCGMAMQEFEELVDQHYYPAVYDWIEKAVDVVWERTLADAKEIVAELLPPKRKPRKDAIKHAVVLMEEIDRPYDLIPARKGKSRPSQWHLQIQALLKTVDTYLTRVEEEGDEAKTPEKFPQRVEERLDPMPQWVKDVIEESCGPVPKWGFEIVPDDEAVYYACRDPDAGLRVRMKIFEKARRVEARVYG